MKNFDLKLFILGVLLILISFGIGLLSTYAFDYFKGQQGRELLIVMFGSSITVGTFIGAIIAIIMSVNKDLRKSP